MHMKTDHRAAGFILVKRFKTGYKFCALECFNGQYDTPKGRRDFGEAAIQTATRELFEETGISNADIDMPWGNLGFRISNLIIFIAETKLDPVVPTSDDAEHQSVNWLEYHAIKERLLPFLVSPFEWANNIINNVDF